MQGPAPCRAIAVLAGVLSGACAGQGGETGRLASAGAGAEQACFFQRQAQDFAVLSSSSLIVFAPTRRYAYLVQISPPANQLRFTDTLSFDSRRNRICGWVGDELRLPGSSRTRFAVVDVRRLSDAEVDDLLHGPASEGPEPQDAAPAEIEPVESDPDQ